MLLGIMVIYYNIGSTDFTMISLSDISLIVKNYLWLAFFLSLQLKHH